MILRQHNLFYYNLMIKKIFIKSQSSKNKILSCIKYMSSNNLYIICVNIVVIFRIQRHRVKYLMCFFFKLFIHSIRDFARISLQQLSDCRIVSSSKQIFFNFMLKKAIIPSEDEMLHKTKKEICNAKIKQHQQTLNFTLALKKKFSV